VGRELSPTIGIKYKISVKSKKKNTAEDAGRKRGKKEKKGENNVELCRTWLPEECTKRIAVGESLGGWGFISQADQGQDGGEGCAFKTKRKEDK